MSRNWRVRLMAFLVLLAPVLGGPLSPRLYATRADTKGKASADCAPDDDCEIPLVTTETSPSAPFGIHLDEVEPAGCWIVSSDQDGISPRIRTTCYDSPHGR